MSYQNAENGVGLANFDQLPDSAFIRLPVVQTIFDCSVSTVWRLVKSGAIRTHKLSPRTTAFNVGEIRQYIASRTN